MFQYQVKDFYTLVRKAQVAKVVGYIPAQWKFFGKNKPHQIVDVATPNCTPMFVTKVTVRSDIGVDNEIFVISSDNASTVYLVRTAKPLTFILADFSPSDRAIIREAISYHFGGLPKSMTGI